MDKEQIMELKKKAKHLEPVVRLGKNGLTEGALEQLDKVLKKQGLIKVKLLRSFVDQNDRKEVAKELALKLKAELIDQIGFVIVLHKNIGKSEKCSD